MEYVSNQLHWEGLNILGNCLPSSYVCRERHVRLIVNRKVQYMILDQFFPPFEITSEKTLKIWIEQEGKRIVPSDPVFYSHVACMIRQRGFLANLSLRENLLLPFLYHGEATLLKKAECEVADVAEFLGLASLLDEQAGEHSVYIHALVSLGHCLLKRPDVIVAQEVLAGMPPEHSGVFRAKVKEVIAQLKPGVLYLTSSRHGDTGLNFSRTYEMKWDNVH